MGKKTNRTVVRNQAYRGGEFSIRERHNERKNERYGNGDIDPARADMNIHFRRVLAPDGTQETYEQTFNRLLAESAVVKRGLQADAKLFDELVFDVNTAYFEEHGGYEYAMTFFEEAYSLAVKEIGGEQYILSAVMHADERNSALSEELGRDVYHYHLHVVYVPIVEKQILWSKRTKDPALIGTVKEVIPQISHSKKWPNRVPVERNGKTIMLNSYSLLQDRFYEHMKTAGFEGFERGEHGSTAEHLSDLEYKTKQEKERNIALGVRVEQKEKHLTALNKKISIAKQTGVSFSEIEQAAKPTLLGKKVEVSQTDWAKISDLAKKGVLADAQKADMQRKLDEEKRNSEIWRGRYERLKNPPLQQQEQQAVGYQNEHRKDYRQEER